MRINFEDHSWRSWVLRSVYGEQCKCKGQLKIYFKQAFDLFLGLPQALKMVLSTKHNK